MKKISDENDVLENTKYGMIPLHDGWMIIKQQAKTIKKVLVENQITLRTTNTRTYKGESIGGKIPHNSWRIYILFMKLLTRLLWYKMD